MNPFQSLERKKGLSRRSQRSWLEQQKLEAELQICDGRMAWRQKRLAEDEAIVARLNEAAMQDRYVHPDNLTLKVTEIESHKRQLVEFKKLRNSLCSQIKALAHPSHSRASERRKQQALVCKLGSRLLENSRAIDRRVKELREALEGQQRLIEDLEAVARSIDLATGLDSDKERFGALLRSLPVGVANSTKCWAARITGEGSGKKVAHLVEQTTLVLPETLAHSGVYKQAR